jgi:hypothetical protein
MKLTEILDKVLSFKVTEDTNEAFFAEFKAGSREIRFYASHDESENEIDKNHSGEWTIEFSEVVVSQYGSDSRNEYGATGSGNELAVFATLKAILKEFIKAKKPGVIKFDADKSEGNRVNLYTRLVKKNIPFGYKLQRDDGDDNTIYAKFKIIKEALDKPLPYTVTNKTAKFFDAQFKAGEREIIFTAQYTGGSFWDISFAEREPGKDYESTKKTGSGNEFAVFATVKAILNQFINEYNPQRLMIDSFKGEANRTKLYQRMITKNLPAGWKMDRDDAHPSYTTFNLIKEI